MLAWLATGAMAAATIAMIVLQTSSRFRGNR
jgi:hypothetical protein